MANTIGLIGYMALTGAFILCILAALLALISHFKRFRGFSKLVCTLVHAQTAFISAAVLSLFVLLQSGAYQFDQIFTAVEAFMPAWQRAGGLWSGQAASLMFWALIMSAAISLAIAIGKNVVSEKQLMTIVLILEFTLLFFLAPDIFVSNPFMKIFRLPSGEIITAVFPPPNSELLVPVDGQGMNPALRHIAMLLHPPTLYLGLIGFFLPYAFGLSAMLHGDDSHGWIVKIFPIALIAWIFLTIGMLLGSWWAYTILGWGGYWGWDAVEISGLLPWLLSFGLLHAMRQAMSKGHFKAWVYGFAFAIVILTFFGILITRSGILESVHAYASGPMGPILTALIVSHLAAVVFAWLKNKKNLADQKKSQRVLLQDHLNHWFFRCVVALVVVYLFGQTLPLNSQLVFERTLSFTAVDYERSSAPLLFALMMLTALCPLSSMFEKNRHAFWRAAAGCAILALLFPVSALFSASISWLAILGFWASGFLLLCWLYSLVVEIGLPILKKKPSRSWKPRLGMVCIHLGLAVMALGIMGVEAMSFSQPLQLTPSDPAMFNGFIVRYESASSAYNNEANPGFSAAIHVTSDSGNEFTIYPAIVHYTKTGNFSAEPAVRPGFRRDIQVVLENFPRTLQAPLNIRIAVFSMMSWIWAGGGLMALGGILPLLFRRSRSKVLS